MNSDIAPTARRSWPRRLLNRLEVDKAVFFSVATRAWQLIAGLVTALLMTQFFNPVLQGFYYTFFSLIALQTFFELGFQIVVINLCSHEWAQLKLDEHGRIAGDPKASSRLASLGRRLVVWYGQASLLFVVIVSVAGLWVIEKPGIANVAWRTPWFCLVVLSGGLLFTVPLHALLEGCNQVVSINVFRLIQAMLANLVVWVAMIYGAGLWVAVAATATRLIVDLFFLGGWYRRFFELFLRPPAGPIVPWRTEIWPLQWRIGVLGIVSYFMFYLFTPVMWTFHGEVVAGQMGMTWTVVTALQAAALAWVQTRVPRFGYLIHQRDFAELDRIFFRLTGLAAVAMSLAGISFWLFLLVLNHGQFRIANRVLAPAPTLLLLGGALVQVIVACQSMYVRAHKREPFLAVGVALALITGLCVWQFGARYGPLGVGASYLLVQLFLFLPVHSWYVRVARREWRG